MRVRLCLMRRRLRTGAGEKDTPHAAELAACSLDRLPQRVSQCQRADGVLRVSGRFQAAQGFPAIPPPPRA